MKKAVEQATEGPGNLVSNSGVAGSSTRESSSDKAIRYEAQIIAKLYGKTLEEALAIAKTSLAAKEAADSRIRDKNRKLAQKKKHKRMQGLKKSGYIYKIYGPPMSGGLPGLGKQK